MITDVFGHFGKKQAKASEHGDDILWHDILFLSWYGELVRKQLPIYTFSRHRAMLAVGSQQSSAPAIPCLMWDIYIYTVDRFCDSITGSESHLENWIRNDTVILTVQRMGWLSSLHFAPKHHHSLLLLLLLAASMIELQDRWGRESERGEGGDLGQGK